MVLGAAPPLRVADDEVGAASRARPTASLMFALVIHGDARRSASAAGHAADVVERDEADLEPRDVDVRRLEGLVEVHAQAGPRHACLSRSSSVDRMPATPRSLMWLAARYTTSRPSVSCQSDDDRLRHARTQRAAARFGDQLRPRDDRALVVGDRHVGSLGSATYAVVAGLDRLHG